MAEALPPINMKQEAKCTICLEYLTDPVTLDCGHNYCQGCITNYCETWEELGEDVECPVCRYPIQKGNFRPNWQLANLVEKIKLLPLNPEKESLCTKHKEKLHLFCKEDEELVCWKCKCSPEHKSHTFLLKEEAAQEFKLTQAPSSNKKAAETPLALLPISMDVEWEDTCPICMEYLRDSVTLDCSHSYCWHCITNYCETWQELGGDLECPVCRVPIQKGNFRRNWQLANIVEQIKLLEKESLCARHKERLSLFCKEDKDLVCWKCKGSPEHKSHTVLPKEEAAQEYKVMIFPPLEILRKERSKILECKAKVEKENQDLLKQIKAEREKTVAQFRQLHQFLEEQERFLLAQIEGLEEQIARRREEHQTRLSEELSSLGHLIWEMERKRRQPASVFLKDISSILRRCKKKETFEKPMSFPPELKWRILDFRDITLFLRGVTKEFKDKLHFGLQLQKANVTLDPKTAHPRLRLSVDYKSVKWGEKVQDLPGNPERFDVLPFVLGREGFTTGRHFWEVNVENERNWAVGVARKSVRRKAMVPFNPERGIWAVGKLTGFGTSSDSSHMSLMEEVKKIRVSLNYEGRQVSFFDADTADLLYLSSASSFSGETLHPFIYILGEAHLKFSP